MFEQYSYKFKFKALLAILVVLSIAAYKRSFGPLINAVKENSTLQQNMKEGTSEVLNLQQLKSDIKYLDNLIGRRGIGKEKIQNEIITFLSGFDKNIALHQLQTIHEYTSTDYTIYSYQLDIIGDLNKMLHVLYEFEKKFHYSKIMSTRFYTAVQSDKKNVLHLSIIFQNYEDKK